MSKNTASKVKTQAHKKESQKVYINAVFQGIEGFINSKSSITVSNKHFVTLKLLRDKNDLFPTMELNGQDNKKIVIPRSRNIIGLLEMKLYEIIDESPKKTGQYIICGISINSSWSERWRVKTEDAIKVLESYIKEADNNKKWNVSDNQDLIIQTTNFVKPHLRYFMFTGHEKDRKPSNDIYEKYNEFIFTFCGLGSLKKLNEITNKIAHDLYERHQLEEALPF